MKKTSKNQWFSVRCVFKHQHRSDMLKRHLYEERITVWRASSFEQAIEQGEREVRGYSRDTDCEYLGFAQAYQLSAERLRSGSEVFSLMRESNFTQAKYLDKHFDTGAERQNTLED